MLRAISTRYFGPTNSRGSRIKAIARKREHDMPELSLTDNWDYGASIDENHCRVAKLLAAKLEWSGLYIGGSTDDGLVFVNAGNGSEVAPPFNGKANRDYFIVEG